MKKLIALAILILSVSLSGCHKPTVETPMPSPSVSPVTEQATIPAKAMDTPIPSATPKPIYPQPKADPQTSSEPTDTPESHSVNASNKTASKPVTTPSAPAPVSTPAPTPAPTPGIRMASDQQLRQVVAGLNAERARNGAAPLTFTGSGACAAHARQLATERSRRHASNPGAAEYTGYAPDDKPCRSMGTCIPLHNSQFLQEDMAKVSVAVAYGPDGYAYICARCN